MKTRFEEFKQPEIKRGHLKLGGADNKGNRIDVNSLWIERNGKPFIAVMGEYHFSRADEKDWYNELCKMKAGGVTVVATYLFWIYHEETEGNFDFTGNLDVASFVDTAHRAGLDVVLRIGPWAHGECRNGGFPDWLLKKDFKVRSNDPGYLEYVRIWFTKIYDQVKGRFFKDGGNVIAIQLDNELVNNAEHLLKLKQMAQDIGFDVPLYTVTGWNSKYGARIPVDEVLPVFGGYADAPWNNGTAENPLSHNFAFDHNRNDSAVGVDVIHDTANDGWRLPYENYPYATCEIGPGLQPTHHRRPVVSGMDAYAMSMVKLGSGNNLVGYYMFHGGINNVGKITTFNESKESGYPNDYTAIGYDFGTCLSSYGEVREQYRLLNLMHMFLKDFGEDLAKMPAVMPEKQVWENDAENLRYCKRTDGHSGFVFVNHHQRHLKLSDVKDVLIETENVTFPEIKVEGDICFFLPYNMALGKEKLTYATAQPLCREGDAFFFMAVPGIDAEYGIGDVVLRPENTDISVMEHNGVSIVTLSLDKAKYLRKLDSGLYLGDECDIYETEAGIKCVEPGSFAYAKWNGSGFVRTEVSADFEQAKAEIRERDAKFELFYPYELNLGGERKITRYSIKVTGDGGMVEIPLDYDCMQIYVDGKMIMDDFYTGRVFRIPAKLLYDKDCYAVCSERKDDFYMEK
ncbi:MAG: beta-galactosidase [Lachnospiraceae bacterium]|nr:beta-galactosidase [Lachnospiraceae bacterium]